MMTGARTFRIVPSRGIEPLPAVPKTATLSVELRGPKDTFYLKKARKLFFEGEDGRGVEAEDVDQVGVGRNYEFSLFRKDFLGNFEPF